MQDVPADPSQPPSDVPAAPMQPREPRQRWRLVVARDEAAAPQTQRELADDWEAALARARLPLARTGDESARAKVSYGAPLPTGMAADGELIDVVLTERWPVWRLREALEPVVPPGWRLVGAHDVWLAGPPLAGRVAAADYLVTLTGDGPPTSDLADRLATAAATLLAARRIERQRRKGDRLVTYDLRPLLVDVAIRARERVEVETRTRLHPELGSGRPEAVVEALGDVIGEELAIASIRRLRLALVDDLEVEDQGASSSTARASVGRK